MIHSKFKLILWLNLVVLLLNITAGPRAMAQHENRTDLDTSTKPNILFIFADDHSYNAIHETGNEEIITPNLDRLAQQSTRFTRAYNMGGWNGAVCLASRKMLNTGRFIWHADKLNLKEEVGEGRLWPQLLKKAGYETYFTGKWHVATDAKQIFDHSGNVRPGMPNQVPKGYNRPLDKKPDSQWQPWDKSKGGYWKGGTHWSEVIGNDAIEFLNQSKQSDKPFFMYVAFNAPHDPRQSPKEFVEMYASENITIPENFLPEYEFKDDIGCSKHLRDERLAPFPRTEQSIQVQRQEYYAIITHMDQQIGRILLALEASGQAENTVVIFSADHGLAVGHHGLVGKQNMYEHSLRVPFFIKGPNISANKDISTPIYLQDVMPTTLTLAGIPIPEFVQFKSLLPLIRGQRDQQYDSIYGGYRDLQRAVIDDNMKLILYPAIPRSRLFNLKNDPHEMNDLIDDPNYKEFAKKLFARFLKLQQQTGDELDVSKTFPDLADAMNDPHKMTFKKVSIQKSGGFAGISQTFTVNSDGTRAADGNGRAKLTAAQMRRLDKIITDTDWEDVPKITRTPNTADVFNYFVQLELPEKTYEFSIDELALRKSASLLKLVQLIEK